MRWLLMFRRGCALSAVLLLLGSVRGSAQLRPLEPFHWSALLDGASVQANARVAWFESQRASLAGTVGRLIELGELRAHVRAGSIVLEFAGTPQRFFQDERILDPPAEGTAPPPIDGERHDAGDYRVATAIPLTALNGPAVALLRFGTRLPTTDNRVGLDRDQTDFFALLGGLYRRNAWRTSLELGLGIQGTRSSGSEQSDVLLYAGTLEYAGRLITPAITLVGQNDLRARALRGNEDLAELRASIRVGKNRWLEAAFVRGLSRFSPRAGFWIGGGFARGVDLP